MLAGQCLAEGARQCGALAGQKGRRVLQPRDKPPDRPFSTSVAAGPAHVIIRFLVSIDVLRCCRGEKHTVP